MEEEKRAHGNLRRYGKDSLKKTNKQKGITSHGSRQKKKWRQGSVVKALQGLLERGLGG